ncbi:PH domain-containing protein [Candidatus Saccharibacteria bacterium]|nr:PH domain-containing protein [Candidatus Saccharibacteria bacterium]
MDHERIVAVVCGRYFGGYAILVATDQRLLLIDKKTLFMTVEDIRYDMISEIDYSSRLFDSTLTIFTINKQHRFTSMKYRQQLRTLTNYVQQRVMELRHYGQAPEFQQSNQNPRLEPSTYRPQITQAPSAQRSADIHQIMGAAALHDSPRTSLNPYGRVSLMTRRQISRTP